jgi:uncharacterized protein involved in outer membrane biogenesis
MRRFIKILGGFLAVLVVLSVGAVVYVLNVDLNDWKPEIQSAVKDATGRTLVIQGPIEFELGTDTRLKATGITLSNADWGSRPNMVEVDSVEVSLKLFSLLGSTPDITLAHVDGVRAIIEKNDQGVSNTDFQAAASGDTTSEAQKGDGESHSDGGYDGGGDLVLPIIRDLRIADVQVVMKDPAVGPERVFTLTELTLGSQSETDPLKLNLDAAYDDLDLIMSGTMGALQTMTDSNQPTPIDFVGNLAGIDVSINGQIQDLAGQKGIDVTVSALGDELANAAKIAGIDVPKLGGFKVDATLKGSGDALSVDPLIVDVGTADVIHATVNGKIADAIGTEGVDLTVMVESKQIGNLSPITQAFAKQDVPALGPLTVNLKVLGGMEDGLQLSGLDAKVGKADLLLISAAGKVDDLMRQSGIDLAITANAPQIGNLSPIAEKFSGQKIPALGPMAMTMNVRGDMARAVSVEDLSFNLGSQDMVTLALSGAIKDVMKQNGIDLNVAANSPELGNLSPIAKEYSGQTIPKMGPMSMTAKVAGGIESGLGLSDLAVDFGKPETIQVQVNGGVTDLLAQKGVDLTVKAVSPEVGNLSPLVKAFSSVSVPALGPLNLNMKVAGDAQDVMTLSQLDLALGTEKTLLVEARGTVSDLIKLSGADVDFKVVSPNLSVLSDLAPGIPPIGPVDISGSLKGDNGKPITLDPFTAKIGSSDIAGTATIDATGDVLSILARLSSTRFDINDVNPPAKGKKGTAASGGASTGTATGSGTSAGAAPAADGRLIPNDPLPLDVMKTVNADIEYKAATFIATVAELTNMEIKVMLKDGKLDITPFKAGVGEGTVDGAISLDASQANPPISVSIDGKKMGLESLLAGAGMRDKIVGPLDVNIDLKGAGSTPRAIAGSLNGNTLVSLYDSRVLKKAFEDALGDTLAGLLATENGWVVIDCAVLDYDLKDGLMETKAGYTASGPITVITEGTIDLKTEKLDLSAKPAGGGGFTSVPLVITGTFANPSVIPDPKAIGLGIVAGLLSGGIAPALLAVVGDLPAGHPCKKEVEESKEQVENAPAQQPQQNAPADILKDPGKAIEEGVGGALKGLFGN